MFFDLFFWIVYVFGVIVCHEVGHFLAAKKLGYDAKLSLFSVSVSGVVSDHDDFWIAFFGVALGFLPVLLMPALGFELWVWFVTCLFYFGGSREELVLLWVKRRFFYV